MTSQFLADGGIGVTERRAALFVLLTSVKVEVLHDFAHARYANDARGVDSQIARDE